MNQTDTIISPADALERAGGDQTLALELFSMLHRELPDYINNLQLHYNDGDLTSVYELVHKIHGATKYLGVPELHHAASSYEGVLKRSEAAHYPRHYLQLMDALDHLQHAQLQFDD